MPNHFLVMRNKSKIILIVNVVFLYLFIYYRSSAQTFNYPATPKQPVSDTIFGKVVVDNYRWLEDMNNKQVKDWIKVQSDLTNKLLDEIPGRNALLEDYKKMDKQTPNVIRNVSREANRYFYKNVGKLYYREGETGKEILLFDPRIYSKDNFEQVTYYFRPSQDGKKVALNLTENGKADISTVRIINVETKQFYPDSLYPVGSLQAWTPDSKGFIYAALQTSDQLSKNLFQDIPLKFHKMGTPIPEDKIIISRQNNADLTLKPEDFIFVGYSSDNKYLIANIWSRGQENNRKFFAPASDLLKNKINWKLLVKTEDQVRDAVVIYNDKVFMVSRKDATKYKVVMTSLADLDIMHTKTIIPESKYIIQNITRTRDYLFINKSDGINTFLDQYNFETGEIQHVKLPLQGFTWLQTFDVKTNDCSIHVSSWKQPTTRYNYNPVTYDTRISSFNNTVNYPGVNDLVVEELEIPGHDGVMIPLSLIYNKNIKKDGNNVVYMTGYGSYGMSSEPWFNILYLPLLNRNVIIAKTHPRGGGEKGFEWHTAGLKATKSNTWNDFISSGEYLIKNGYTSSKRLIGEGTSAGGILIGRAITERPDLFAAAINNVPLSNPLRGENRPNGILDSKEFGTVKDSVEAMGLIKMDAYLHVTPGVKYPAVIAVTGINDTKVPFWQPAKFIAALQNANTSGKPILLQVNYDSGHWTDEKFVMFRNYANMYAFALWQVGHKDFQPVQNK